MPSGLGPFRRKWVNTGDPVRDLRIALDHIWRHLENLPGTPTVQVDESGGSGSVTLPDGGGTGGGGGGGGGSSNPHPLLDGTENDDTAQADPVAGDLVYANASALWDRLPIGSNGTILGVASGAPAWTTLETSGIQYPIPGFGKSDISNLGTSYAALNRAAGTSGGQSRGIVMQSAGSVVALSGTLSGTVGGTSISVKVRVWDTGGGAYRAGELELTIAAANQDGYVTQTPGVVPFAAGDRLEVWGVRSGSVNVRDLSIDPWVAI